MDYSRSVTRALCKAIVSNILLREPPPAVAYGMRCRRTTLAITLFFFGCGGKSPEDVSSLPGTDDETDASGGALPIGGRGDGATVAGGIAARTLSGGTAGTTSHSWIWTHKNSGGTSMRSGTAGRGGDGAGGFAPQAGSAGASQMTFCDMTALQAAVTVSALDNDPRGWCHIGQDAVTKDVLGVPWGAILIDDEGRLSTITGPARGAEFTISQQGWLCPSSAGTTLLYWCEAPM